MLTENQLKRSWLENRILYFLEVSKQAKDIYWETQEKISTLEDKLSKIPKEK